MYDPAYMEQVRLLLQSMPAVATCDCFALKGGSGINLFLRDMPRVSVDIDLTYLPVQPRAASLNGIEEALKRIKSRIEEELDDIVVNPSVIQGHVAKLTVMSPTAQIKIEPNLTLRGAVGQPAYRDLCVAAQEQFGYFVTTAVVSVEDMYGGKLCAALDRQHPRDLFDVKVLLDDTGITAEIRRAFVVYLGGHNRPMHELLAPNAQDIAALYSSEFAGMADAPPPVEELEEVQSILPTMLLRGFTAEERHFLLSMKSGDPDWHVLGIEGLESMPALQWKLLNIRKMDARKRDEQLKTLKELLGQ